MGGFLKKKKAAEEIQVNTRTPNTRASVSRDQTSSPIIMTPDTPTPLAPPPVPSTSTISASVLPMLLPAAQTSPVILPPLKRKRGRPPKNTLTPQAQAQGSTATSTPVSTESLQSQDSTPMERPVRLTRGQNQTTPSATNPLREAANKANDSQPPSKKVRMNSPTVDRNGAKDTVDAVGNDSSIKQRAESHSLATQAAISPAGAGKNAKLAIDNVNRAAQMVATSFLDTSAAPQTKATSKAATRNRADHINLSELPTRSDSEMPVVSKPALETVTDPKILCMEIPGADVNQRRAVQRNMDKSSALAEDINGKTIPTTPTPNPNHRQQQKLVSSPGGGSRRWATLQEIPTNPLHPPSFTRPTTPSNPLHPPSFSEPTRPHIFKPQIHSGNPPGVYHPNPHIQIPQLAFPNAAAPTATAPTATAPTATAPKAATPNQPSAQLLNRLTNTWHPPGITPPSLPNPIQPPINRVVVKQIQAYEQNAPLNEEDTYRLYLLNKIHKIQSSLANYTLSHSPFRPRSPPTRWLDPMSGEEVIALNKLQVVERVECHFCMEGMEQDWGIMQFAPHIDPRTDQVVAKNIWGGEGKMLCNHCKESTRYIPFPKDASHKGQGKAQVTMDSSNLSNNSHNSPDQQQQQPVLSRIDFQPITRFMPNLQCRTSAHQTLSVTSAQICQSCKTKKMNIIAHARHTVFGKIELLGDRGVNRRCMVCLGRAAWVCRGCGLLVCEGCEGALRSLCKGWLDNLFYCYGVGHGRNDAFLLRRDDGGYDK